MVTEFGSSVVQRRHRHRPRHRHNVDVLKKCIDDAAYVFNLKRKGMMKSRRQRQRHAVVVGVVLTSYNEKLAAVAHVSPSLHEFDLNGGAESRRTSQTCSSLTSSFLHLKGETAVALERIDTILKLEQFWIYLPCCVWILLARAIVIFNHKFLFFVAGLSLI